MWPSQPYEKSKVTDLALYGIGSSGAYVMVEPEVVKFVKRQISSARRALQPRTAASNKVSFTSLLSSNELVPKSPFIGVPRSSLYCILGN